MIEAAALDLGEMSQIVRSRGSKRSVCVDRYSTRVVDGRGDARWAANESNDATTLATTFKISLASDALVLSWSLSLLNAANIICATMIATQIAYQT